MRAVVLLLCLFPVIAIAQQGAEAPEWLFDDKEAKDELKTWGAINQLQPLEIVEVEDQNGEKRSVLLTESTGGDPFFFPGGDWNVANYEPFSGKDYHILYMGVRVNMPNTWQIYYVTQEDGTWGETQRQNFDVNAVDGFENLEIEVERGDWQKRTILRFRIDPGTAANVKAEIDYISFRGVPEGQQISVDSHGKLPITWAKLRLK